MTNVELVARKLATLVDHIERLRTRRPASLAALRADLLVQDALAMSVLVVVQEAQDIALHVASDENWELASTFRESFVVLARHDVVAPELANAMAAIANLRNRIAHGYGSVDVERIWNELPSGIETFAAYAGAIGRFLARRAPRD